MNAVQNHEPTPELIPFAREILADTPVYVEHISNTMTTCHESLRAGADEDGLRALARGASDLDQFVQLFERLVMIARPSETPEVQSFRNDLKHCVIAMERQLNQQDMLGLCDQIDGALLPLLSRWPSVSGELDAGLSQHCA
jgi:hypothetical protein